MPKSSTATCTPLSLRAWRMDAVDSARFIRTLSVSSSSRDRGSRPVSARMANRFSRKFSSRNSIAETLTAMVVAGRPASIQARACAHASRRTQAPIGRMRPQSSATGINWAGGIGPRVGMGPAYQRFRPCDGSCPQIDLRLVVQREFLPFQGAPQTLLDGLPLHGPDVHGGLEKLIALRPFSLAWYIAVSAFLMSVSASRPSSG